MLYILLKVTHIISAALLTTGMIYSIKRWWSVTHDSSDQTIHRNTWFIIIPTLFFLLVSGFIMLVIKKYDLSALWISTSFAGTGIVLIAWLAFIVNTLLTEASHHQRDRIIQGILLFICSVTILVVIFMMTNKIS